MWQFWTVLSVVCTCTYIQTTYLYEPAGGGNWARRAENTAQAAGTLPLHERVGASVPHTQQIFARHSWSPWPRPHLDYRTEAAGLNFQ